MEKASEGFGGVEALYGEALLEASRSRARRGIPPGASAAGAFNPLCGDKVAVGARIEGGRVAEAGFEGEGCAISMASAHALCEALRGLEAGRAAQLAREGAELWARGGEPPPELAKAARLLGGVRRFPARVKCATMAWRAMEQALAQAGAPGAGEGPGPG